MDLVLKKYSAELIEKARRVKALVFDIDGVMTSGGIIYTNAGDEQKIFNVRDGQIISHLKESGIMVGAITGRHSVLVDRRCKELKLDFYYQAVKDKFEKYEQILDQFNLEEEQVAYIGDDIIDIKLIRRAGIGVAPADAPEYVKQEANLITEAKGGEGVIRETADFILAAQGLLEGIVNGYLE